MFAGVSSLSSAGWRNLVVRRTYQYVPIERKNYALMLYLVQSKESSGTSAARSYSYCCCTLQLYS